jgi:hypothetical protein
MKVRFLGQGALGQREAQGSAALTIGLDYPVLELYIRPERSSLLRIEYSQDELPALFDLRMFEVVSDKVPEDWCVVSQSLGALTFRPREWVVPDFWEAFANREPWAVECYRQGRSRVLRAE